MNTNIITDKSLNTFHHISEEFPKAVMSKWYWGEYYLATYKLPNNVRVMSERQLAKAVGQPIQDVQSFLKQNHLQGISVRIPNGRIMKSYTLTILGFYLRQLLQNGRLNFHRFAFTYCQWEYFISDLLMPQIRENPIPNPYFFHSNYRLTSAKPIQVEFGNSIEMEILILGEGEYRIGFEEGMGCIGSNSNWLTDNSFKRGQLFSRLKLSNEVVECQVATSEGVKFFYSLCFSNWLLLWEYFAYQRNKKAIYLLRACAQESFAVRVAKALGNGN
jgi:hypothetical protein